MERKWWTLIAVSVAIFMLLLDITVVNVALPDIQRSLHSSFSDLQWVVNAYALTLAAFLLTAGSVADLIGRRRVFVAGLVVFTDLLGRLRPVDSPADAEPRAGRAGHRRGDDVRDLLALIAQAFHGKERGTAFGVFGAVTGGAVGVGPVVGGIITSGIGWEWIFFVNVPIGVVAVFIALTQCARTRATPTRPGLTGPGLVTFSGALFLLVYALVQGNDAGLGLDRDRLAPERRRGAAGRVRDRRACSSPGRCSTSRCSAAPRSLAPASSRSPSRARSSRCSST